MSIDMYGEKVADAAQLIRDLTGGKEWFHEFDRNTQHTLELFIACMDKVKADILASLPSTAVQASVREVPEWQPIETAPKDGTRFLAVYEGKVDFYHWQEMRDFPTAPVGWRNSFITVYPENEGPKFWMPLPAAPVQQEGE